MLNVPTDKKRAKKPHTYKKTQRLNLNGMPQVAYYNCIKYCDAPPPPPHTHLLKRKCGVFTAAKKFYYKTVGLDPPMVLLVNDRNDSKILLNALADYIVCNTPIILLYTVMTKHIL